MLDAVKLNARARAFPPVPTAVVIPVIVAAKPATAVIPVKVSTESAGAETRTCGGAVRVYPKPALVTDAELIKSFTIATVPVAVVPTPTPTAFGAAIFSVAEPEYPAPSSVTFKELIVPVEETTAVTAADTCSVDVFTSNPLTLVILIEDSFSS